jgi:hypothetical protein
MKPILRNVAILAATWLVAFAAVQLALRSGDSALWTEVGRTAALAAGLVAAWRFRATAAAILLAVFSAASVAELAIHRIWGVAAVQGRASHLAVLAAAAVAVLLGAVVTARRPLAS